MSPTYASVPTRDSNEDAQRTTAAPEAHFATTTLKVEGMTCGACTSAVEAGFKGVDGIASASISLVMERAVVIHDPKTISADAIKEIIEDRGFDAKVLSTDLPVPATTSNPKKQSGLVSTTVAIQGMTCGACTSAIEEGFKNNPGVKKFSISLLSERAVIEHDPALLSVQDIAEIIDDRGFEPDIVDSVEVEVEESSSNQEPVSNIATTTVAIEGMTCGACTSAVEGGFKGVDGVIKFNISLLAERAVITHDITKLSPEKIAEIIDDRGFDPHVLSTQQETLNHGSGSLTTHFKLYGCSNAGMANALEEKLKELSGIVAASVTMATDRLTVTYQPTAIGLRAIVEAVEAQGLNALLAESQDNNAQLESLAKTKEINEWRLAFRISFAFAVPVFLISMILPMCLPGIDFGKCQIIPGLFLGDIICFVLTVPVQFGIGKRFYISAFKSLKHGSPTMDVLVMLGTSAAFFFSILTVVVSIAASPHTRPHTLFDTSTMLITIICLGRYLENSAKGQTSKALSRLMSLAPSSATIYADPIAAEKALEKWGKKSKGKAEDEADGPSGSANEERTIPTELLQVGDIVIIKPGDQIPADATLIRGETYVDESMITGEAMPVQKRIGNALIGGTVNGEGRIDCRVTRAGRDTQLSQIVRLVQNAQTTRAPIQQLADTLAGYFIPVILILGMVTFLGWMVLSHALPNPPKIFLADTSGGKIMVCVKLCISVIVFACPCALGLATPTAVMVGTGVGAENGILIKGGLALQRTTKVTQVVFDKTGTITYGKMSVVQSNLVFDWSEDDWMRRLWWSIIGLAEMGSEHPIGQAILGAAKKELGFQPEGTIDGWVGDFKAKIGQGIEASVEPDSSSGKKRYTVLVGNVKFLQNNGVDVPRNAIEQSEEFNSKASKTKVTASAPSSRGAGTTNIFVAIDGKYTGHLCLADKIKEGGIAAISVLHRMGIKTAIVTGDQRSTALAVASVVGIAPEDVYAGVSPDEKQSIISDIQAQGEIVAMVGDGINDSPALATADVGIALASGTDVAMEAADLVLMRPTELMDIPAALSLTRTIFRRIKLNLAWACVYNLIGLPIAMGFFLPFGLHMHPMFAGFAMACSSVSVVLSSLHLKFWQRPRWMDEAAAEEIGGLNWKTRRRSLVDRVRDLFQSRGRAGDKDGYVALDNIETV